MVVRYTKKKVERTKDFEKQRLSSMFDLNGALARAVSPGPARERLREQRWLRTFDRALKHTNKELGVEEPAELMPEREIKDQYDKFPEGRHREKFPLVSEKVIKTVPWKVFNMSKQQWKKLSSEAKHQLRNKAYGMLTRQLVTGLHEAGLNENSNIEEVRKTLTDFMGREPKELTVLNYARRLGIENISSISWDLSMQRYVDKCKRDGLNEKSALEDVRKILTESMGREPSEGTVLTVASRLGISSASTERWKVGMQKYVDKCKRAGLNEYSSIEQVGDVLGDELSPSTIREVASRMGIKTKSWEKNIREYGGNLKQIDAAVERVLEGGKIQPGRRVWLGKAGRLTAGETAAKEWFKEGLSEEQVKKRLEEAGFKSDEIQLLEKFVFKKRKKK